MAQTRQVIFYHFVQRTGRLLALLPCFLLRLMRFGALVGWIVLSACTSRDDQTIHRDVETLDRIEEAERADEATEAELPYRRNAVDVPELPLLPTSTNAPPLTDEEWVKVTQRGAYATEAEPDKPAAERKPSTGIDLGGLDSVLSSLAWIAVIVLLLVLVYFGVRHLKARQNTNVSGRDYGATDELLQASETELITQLNRHLAGGNFRLAIRYRFGQVLQALRSRGLLIWVPGSTNAEYGAALPEALRGQFVGLAGHFDEATYAGREVEQASYASFAAQVLQFAQLAGLEKQLEEVSVKEQEIFAFPQNPTA